MLEPRPPWSGLWCAGLLVQKHGQATSPRVSQLALSDPEKLTCGLEPTRMLSSVPA